VGNQVESPQRLGAKCRGVSNRSRSATISRERDGDDGSSAFRPFGPPSHGFGEAGAADANIREPRELAALGRATEWINSPRLTPPALAGKVVLVDFWTYTCINWLRTLPYIRAWSRKYRQKLVVIGVHTPEFAFEHNLDNVRRAVRQMQIDYPVVIDNEYLIWRAFSNQYWPAVYLVDGRGRVREHYFGEGEYERSEIAIQRLLTEAGAAQPMAPYRSMPRASKSQLIGVT
jgi:thiol-disulfide isomerase/thioredoxin